EAVVGLVQWLDLPGGSPDQRAVEAPVEVLSRVVVVRHGRQRLVFGLAVCRMPGLSWAYRGNAEGSHVLTNACRGDTRVTIQKQRGEPPTSPLAPVHSRTGAALAKWLTSTDHKVIGYLYLITSFGFFLFAGILALLIRAELWEPGLQFVNGERYNELFTNHGVIMLLLFATPLFAGFANAITPLQIGAPDVAFPRLNMVSYWLFLFGGLITVSSFFTNSGAPSFGWFAYTPLSDATYSPGVGG